MTDPLDRESQREEQALDALLQSAHWPQPEPARVARLRRRWQALRKVSAGRPALLLAAAAAGAVIASMASLWRWDASRPVANLAPSAPAADDAPQILSPAHRVAEPTPLSPESLPAETLPAETLPAESLPAESLPGEPPGAFAYAALAASRRVRAAQPPEPDWRLVRAAMDCVLWRPESEWPAAFAPLQAAAELYEQALARAIVACERRIDGSAAADQVAATRVLAEVATWRSFSLLQALAEESRLHAASIPGLARLASPPVLVRLIRVEREPACQTMLLVALGQHADDVAVDAYLRFVCDRRTSRQALTAAASMPAPPVEAWFARLDAHRVADREAAALALGQVRDVRVSLALAALAIERDPWTQSWLGLLDSTEPAAREFVALAWQKTFLRPAMQAASRRLSAWFGFSQRVAINRHLLDGARSL